MLPLVFDVTPSASLPADLEAEARDRVRPLLDVVLSFAKTGEVNVAAMDALVAKCGLSM